MHTINYLYHWYNKYTPTCVSVGFLSPSAKKISRRLAGFGAEKAGTGSGTGKLKKAGKAGNRAGIPVGH